MMKYKKLGNTNIEVSQICLGTMTYGQQNTEKEAFKQMDYALANGINFFDTAELYAIPAKAETYGKTEEIIGNWFQAKRNRQDVILATKIAAGGEFVKHIRGGSNFIRDLRVALEGSLKRLQTDYIDLYQLHWPERETNYFGKLGYIHREDDWEDNLLEVLQLLKSFMVEGKIREIGISNETPWGAMRLLYLAQKHNLPRMVSIQNPYNLLNRTFEIGLSEIAIRENMGLLAYSPIAGGYLSGKYFKEIFPKDARFTLFTDFNRYDNKYSEDAAREYVNLAEEVGLSPVQMALSFVNSRDFLTSNIIGATTVKQLKENIESINIDLSEDVLEKIEEIHTSQPNPAP